MRPAHRDQEAVQVSGFSGALGLGWLPQQLCQALHARHSDNIDVVVTAKGLNEREVDLQGNIILLFLVNGQQAQDHTVRVPERARRRGQVSLGAGARPQCTGEFAKTKRKRRCAGTAVCMLLEG